MRGTLYIVATPIGNLEDMTYRAIRVLNEVDLILAEDTRVTRVLLERYSVTTRTISCNSYSEEGRIGEVLERLSSGESIALVTDAGTPCISDPGYIIVKAAVGGGFEVTAVPGACAATTAISLSGLPSPSFGFYGFFERSGNAVKSKLEAMKEDSTVLSVVYESPHRILDTLQAVKEVFPTAELAVCNDISKKFERIYRGNVDSVIAEIQSNPSSDKGEYTVVIQKNATKTIEEKPSLEALVVDAMVKGNLGIKEAVSQVHTACKKSVSKKEIYAAALKLKELI